MLSSTDVIEEQEFISGAASTFSDQKPNKKTKVLKGTMAKESSGSICFGRKPIRPTLMRFVVISIMSTTFLIQTFSQSIWSAIYEPALLAFPNWTSRSLSLLPIWGNVMSAVLVLPVCLMVDKYGLKVILSCSCCFFTLGTAVRCMTTMYSCTLCLHLSAVFLSVGGVVTTPLIVTMSAQWFPKDERNMATGFCSAISMLGSAATYIIGPMMVSAASDKPRPSPFVMRIQIMHMMYTCLGLNVFVTLLVYLLFPRRRLAPTVRPAPTESRHRACKLFLSIKTLAVYVSFVYVCLPSGTISISNKNLNMWCLVFALTLSTSMSIPWSALIPSTFSRLHVSPKITTQCCFFMIIHTFGLSLSISSFAHRTPRYTKMFIMCSRTVSSIFLLWLMLMMDFDVELTTTRLYCVVLVAFPYSFCSQSLLYEMGVRQMHSLPESFVAGYMMVLNNLFVDFTYVVLYLFPDFDKYWLNIGIFVSSALSILFLYLAEDVSRGSQKCDQHITLNRSDLIALLNDSTTCCTSKLKKNTL